MNTRRPRLIHVQLFGKKCCWNTTVPCGTACLFIWRLWILILALLLLALTLTELIITFVVLWKFWDHKDIFVSVRMAKILMLTDGFFPLWLLVSLTSALGVAIWSIALIFRPSKISFAGIIIYKFITSIITLCIFFGSIFQFTLYFLAWPDSSYRHEVQMWMVNDMGEENPPETVTKRWLDTQTYFDCCGVLSPNDWTTVVADRNGMNATATDDSSAILLPRSCCNVNVHECIESEAWTDGCLDPQIDILKSYTNFNVLSSCLLYFLIDILTGSVNKFFKKFPVESSDSESYEQINDEENPDSFKDEKTPLKSSEIDEAGTSNEVKFRQKGSNRKLSPRNVDPEANFGFIPLNDSSPQDQVRKKGKEDKTVQKFGNSKSRSREIRNSSDDDVPSRKPSKILRSNGNLPEIWSETFISHSKSRLSQEIPTPKGGNGDNKVNNDDTSCDESLESDFEEIPPPEKHKISESQVSIHMKDDLAILLSDKDNDEKNPPFILPDPNQNTDQIRPRKSRPSWNWNSKRSSGSKLLKIPSNDKDLPNWNVWKGLPSKSLNDS